MPAPAPDLDLDDQSDQGILDRLSALDNCFKIVMTGYRTAGKSWLLKRIKERAFEQYGTVSDPSYQTVDTTRDNWSETVGQTNTVDFHMFYDEHPYVIIDIPGERISAILDNRISEARILAPIFAKADALIATMPADAVILGKSIARHPDLRGQASLDELRKEARMVQAFALQMSRVASLPSFARSLGLTFNSAEDLEQITRGRLERHFIDVGRQPIGGKSGLTCPVFMALTKADKVFSLADTSGFGERFPPLAKVMRDQPDIKALFDFIGKQPESSSNSEVKLAEGLSDPWALVQERWPALQTQIMRFFPMARIDYVSAFFGHVDGTTITDEHYDDYPSLGVLQILDWIADVQKVRSGAMHKGVLKAAQTARLRAAGMDPRKAPELAPVEPAGAGTSSEPQS
ncbi:MAG: hypothetical protein AAF127_09815 [Pseudomonadota bacterium]